MQPLHEGEAMSSAVDADVAALDLGQLGAVRGPGAGVVGGGADELAEERLGAVGPRVELRVELGGDEERVVGQLDHLDKALVGRGAAADQALVLEPPAKL